MTALLCSGLHFPIIKAGSNPDIEASPIFEPPIPALQTATTTRAPSPANFHLHSSYDILIENFVVPTIPHIYGTLMDTYIGLTWSYTVLLTPTLHGSRLGRHKWPHLQTSRLRTVQVHLHDVVGLYLEYQPILFAWAVLGEPRSPAHASIRSKSLLLVDVPA